jgi:hypothetical protein
LGDAPGWATARAGAARIAALQRAQHSIDADQRRSKANSPTAMHSA